jgi:glycolate oxidase FAD binding subunit
VQQEQYTLPEGLTLSDIVRPGSIDDIADILRASSERGTPVLPMGGGTSLGTGNHVDVPFLGLDVRGLSGVREYEPADLTASFHAGTTISEVSAILGESGQELPLDLPQAGQGTIGGLIATGFSGPRRLGSGTLKDLLIGCAYVRGDGLVAKAGGMLVKNVSGFEISRLLHGSWGSLAVLTSVNLKVVPKPKADFTFSQRYAGLLEALKAQLHLLEHHPLIHASVIEREADGWALHARLLGRRGALQAQVESMRNDLGSDAGLSEDPGVWRAFNDRWAASKSQVRLLIGARPHHIPELAGVVESWAGVQAMAVSVPTGSIRVRLDPISASRDEVTARLEMAGNGSGVTWVIESAPAAWQGSGSVWSDHGPATSVMTAIKQQFDPSNILNRGRLFV